MSKKIVAEEFKESDYLLRPHESFSTNAIHAGQECEAKFGSVNVPIHLSSTYK